VARDGTKPERPGPEWWQRKELAAVLGVSAQRIDDIRASLADDRKEKIGRRLYLFAPPIVAAWSDQRRMAAVAAGDPDDAATFSGPASPELEKLRRVKREQEELRLEEMRGNLVNRHEMAEAMSVLAAMLRNCGDAMQRRCGDEPYGLLMETLEEFESRIPELVRDHHAEVA
jgi:hypothetical protein